MDKRHEQSLMYMINKINESIFVGSVKAIILYGSCARGNAKYTSDVDILVEVDESVKQINGYKRAALDLVSEGHCIPDDLPDVDIRFQFGDSWRQNPTMYYWNIKREGIELWPSMI